MLLNGSKPHYDICRTKRAIAVATGALKVDRRGLVAVIRRIRQAVLTETPEGLKWIEDMSSFRLSGCWVDFDERRRNRGITGQHSKRRACSAPGRGSPGHRKRRAQP